MQGVLPLSLGWSYKPNGSDMSSGGSVIMNGLGHNISIYRSASLPNVDGIVAISSYGLTGFGGDYTTLYYLPVFILKDTHVPFEIDPLTGVVRMRDYWDADIASSYTLDIRAIVNTVDGSTHYSDWSVVINMPSKVYTTSMESSETVILEEGLDVGHVVYAFPPIHHALNENVVYFMRGDDVSDFSISRITGVVTLNHVTSHQNKPNYRFTVVARYGDDEIERPVVIEIRDGELAGGINNAPSIFLSEGVTYDGQSVLDYSSVSQFSFNRKSGFCSFNASMLTTWWDNASAPSTEDISSLIDGVAYQEILSGLRLQTKFHWYLRMVRAYY